MRPRFMGRLGVADVFTTVNAGLGFIAVVTAVFDPHLAARIILLASIADGLDGILATRLNGSEVGPYLDSLADVASFCVAPAFLVVTVTRNAGLFGDPTYRYVIVAVGAIFVAMGVMRLALYTAYDTEDKSTEGVPSTLAGTILAVAVLAGVSGTVLFLGMGVFAALMVSRVPYPDLRIRDAFIMGFVQALAVLVPGVWHSLFPRVLLIWALGYLVFGPIVYPRAE